ncbi:unnamed protein product [Durusdinium trenchii]|uniref:Fe2OG dioxygenase domain-containing protein n=1 Tax=Durusdinium trenchii TaxID=1381693 RepID=A0ABP0NLJ8_9DINO
MHGAALDGGQKSEKSQLHNAARDAMRMVRRKWIGWNVPLDVVVFFDDGVLGDKVKVITEKLLSIFSEKLLGLFSTGFEARLDPSTASSFEARHVVFEDVAPREVLAELLSKAPQAVLPGVFDPIFTRNSGSEEVFAALDPRTAAASPATLDASGTRQFIEVVRRMKQLVDEEFQLHFSSLHFAQLACRSVEPPRADSAEKVLNRTRRRTEQSQEDGASCALSKEEVDFSTHLAYLDLHSPGATTYRGGDLILDDRNGSLSPAAGRMVALELPVLGPGRFHGLEAGLRCHVGIGLIDHKDIMGKQIHSLAEAEALLAGFQPQFRPQDWRWDDENFERLCEVEASEAKEEIQVEGAGLNLKVEILSDLPDPQVIRVRGFLAASEAAELVKLSEPLLEEAVVLDQRDLVLASYRASRTAWLDDKDSDLLAEISRRIEAFTGLSLQSAEDFQVAYYHSKEAGHYAPHFDWGIETQLAEDFGSFRDGQGAAKSRGPRLATFLIYLSDVPGGGATTFVRENLTFRPEAGTALFWFNLKPPGDGDELVKHGACAVKNGEKFIMTKWINVVGNQAVLQESYGLPRIARHWRQASSS